MNCPSVLSQRICNCSEEDSGIRRGDVHSFIPISQIFPGDLRNRSAWRRAPFAQSHPRPGKRTSDRGLHSAQGPAIPSSIAAVIVHRPSPESATLPAKLDRSGFSVNSMAQRSRSHEAITLPRRHSSVISARLKSY